jgi:hypothetical protein
MFRVCAHVMDRIYFDIPMNFHGFLLIPMISTIPLIQNYLFVDLTKIIDSNSNGIMMEAQMYNFFGD